MDPIILATFLQVECMAQESTIGLILGIGFRDNTRQILEMAKEHTTIITMSMNQENGKVEYY
jgi:hypothetical protein